MLKTKQDLLEDEAIINYMVEQINNVVSSDKIKTFCYLLNEECTQIYSIKNELTIVLCLNKKELKAQELLSTQDVRSGLVSLLYCKSVRKWYVVTYHHHIKKITIISNKEILLELKNISVLGIEKMLLWKKYLPNKEEVLLKLLIPYMVHLRIKEIFDAIFLDATVCPNYGFFVTAKQRVSSDNILKKAVQRFEKQIRIFEKECKTVTSFFAPILSKHWDNGCDLLSISPTDSSVSALSILEKTFNNFRNHGALYLKVGNQLSYINTNKDEDCELKLSDENLARFDSEIVKDLPINTSRKLTNKELKNITLITGHTHLDLFEDDSSSLGKVGRINQFISYLKYEISEIYKSVIAFSGYGVSAKRGRTRDYQEFARNIAITLTSYGIRVTATRNGVFEKVLKFALSITYPFFAVKEDTLHKAAYRALRALNEELVERKSS